MPKIIVFDLDGTLTESKQPLSEEMTGLLAQLLEKTRVGVISGGALPQFLTQIVERLPINANLKHLYILPTSGAALYEWNDAAWKKIYEERLSEADAEEIERALIRAAEETGLIDFGATAYGPRIEYRGGQVSLSALGQHTPIALKRAWDPDRAKRRKLQAAIQKHLSPKFHAAMGGATTIDVTKEGIDKAYGIHQLSARLGIPEQDMLYVGDELQEHGNDAAVFKTEAKTKEVKNPDETARFLRSLLET